MKWLIYDSAAVLLPAPFKLEGWPLLLALFSSLVSPRAIRNLVPDLANTGGFGHFFLNQETISGDV